MTAVDDWLDSGRPAVIAGRGLRPRRQQQLPIPFVVTRGQASSYWLDGDDGSGWILKSFLPSRRPQRAYVDAVAGCIPQLAELRCGWQRRVLAASDLDAGDGNETFTSPELATFIDGTVLMPRLSGDSWGGLLGDVADGTVVLTAADRKAIAGWLAELVLWLEMANCSHRDLSATNVLVDRRSGDLHLIDWDALFHPSLTFQPNTTLGTPGYMAPWAVQDAGLSWQPGADRFALAVCIAEALGSAPGLVLRGDGSLFDQGDLGRETASFHRVLAALDAVSPAVGNLFRAAWLAGSFAECPSPAQWLAVFVDESARPAVTASVCPQLAGSTTAALRHQRLAGLLTSLRHALHNGDIGAIEAALDAEPMLARLLSADERARLAEVRGWSATLRAVRGALRNGDDAAVLQAVCQPRGPWEQLRPGEVWAIDQAARRRKACGDLERAILTGDDQAISVLWRQAVLLGLEIPAHLAAPVRAARLRRLRQPPSPVAQYLPLV